MTRYRRLTTTSAPRRTYSITVGLREGFGDDGVLHDLKDAESVILCWIVERIEAGRGFLSGTLGQQAVLYGLGSQDEAEAKCEPVAVFTGFVSVRRTPAPSNEEVCDMLDELAARLGRLLGQARVNVEYLDTTWVIEAEDAVLPREPHQ